MEAGKKNLLDVCGAYVGLLRVVGDVLDSTRKKSRKPTRKIFSEKDRESFGLHEQMFRTIKDRDTEYFFKSVRMGVQQYELLLTLLEGRLTKSSQRKPISAECRLSMTLMYLAHGGSRHILSVAFRISPKTVGKIIVETCNVIWEELHKIYVAFPNECEWKQIADDFFAATRMPNCVGAIDGKHINIVCPPNAGSLYYNYKGHHSIVLMAICDANYCFTTVDIGAFGSQSDGGIFAKSSFGNKIVTGTLPLPQDAPLPGTDDKFPYYFVADAAFPLKSNLMRPYPGRQLIPSRERFNRRLSQARRYIENTFGVLCARWRVLLAPLQCHPESADAIIKATIVLHNFLMLNKTDRYCPEKFVDAFVDGIIVEGEWREDSTPLQSYRQLSGHNARREAFNIRDFLKDYIVEN